MGAGKTCLGRVAMRVACSRCQARLVVKVLGQMRRSWVRSDREAISSSVMYVADSVVRENVRDIVHVLNVVDGALEALEVRIYH